MSVIKLSDANLSLDAFKTALKEVEISVSCGRHFNFVDQTQNITATMCEMTDLYKSYLPDDTNREELKSLRDRIALLNFKANGQLENAGSFAQIMAWILSRLSGTSGNYHSERLFSESNEAQKKLVLSANIEEFDEALAKCVKLTVKGSVLEAFIDDKKDLRITKIREKVYRAFIEIKNQDIYSKIEVFTDAIKELDLADKKDLFCKLAEKTPYLAHEIADLITDDEGMLLTLYSTVPVLNEIALKAFAKIDRAIV